VDPIIKEALLVIFREKGIDLSEIHFLPDEEREVIDLYTELSDLAEIFTFSPEEVFDAFLLEASDEAKDTWSEIMDYIRS
jgi:hypothetical protein